jgi:hypothetical protein
MVVHRRAVLVACAGGLIALAAILPLRLVVARPETKLAGLPSGITAVPQVRPSEGETLSDEERTVSTRERADAIARAQVWRAPQTAIGRAVFAVDPRTPSMIECRFRFSDLGGTTPKFDCLLPSGKELRVKYGPGSEVPAEVAASRLLTALGFGADTVTLVERLRCYGCPIEPFVTSKIVEATNAQPLYEPVVNSDDGHEDFEWVGIEQRFAASPIESDSQKGWAFFELDSVDPSKGGAPRAHVDALRLLAVFLAHWDNKGENQRLVCLAAQWPQGTHCPEPFLMLHDVGSTFGPNRVDLEAWKSSKIWEDRQACKLSMEELPYGGGTFGPTRVSERGRRFLARMLEQLTDAQLTDLFTTARFDKPRSPLKALKGASPVPEWVRVFKTRVQAISEGPQCPDA